MSALAKAGALFVGAMLLATSGAAKSRCDPPEIDRLAAIVGLANGDLALIVATVQRRMSTPQLECWASQTGDKRLLLDLGARFEAGDGVPADPARAETLYANAATPKLGTMFIYIPAVGKGAARVMPVRTGPDIPGLAEGDFRRGLMHVEGRAAKPSYRRGVKLIERAARTGYAPAIEKLAVFGRVRT